MQHVSCAVFTKWKPLLTFAMSVVTATPALALYAGGENKFYTNVIHFIDEH